MTEVHESGLPYKDFYPGKRLSYDGSLCTVRYHGPLAGTKGRWVGVEWDDSSRGKHDGTHRGQRIFKCLSTSTTCASFVRPSRRTDPQRSFIEALRVKYGDVTGSDTSKASLRGLEHGQIQPKEHAIEISGKLVEEVGFDKIRRQQAELNNLRIAVLDELRISGVMSTLIGTSTLQGAQEEVAATCPNIVELDLGWNPLEVWQDIAEICRPLRKLRILKCSGVRLSSFDIQSSKQQHNPFQNVQELHLDEDLLTNFQVLELLQLSEKSLFPSLNTLSLKQNGLLSLLDIGTMDRIVPLPTVTSLILDNNLFEDLTPLGRISDVFPNLHTLSLQGNRIARIGGFHEDKALKPIFRNLQELNLSGNSILSYAFIDSLSVLFPNLMSLRISNNPLYDKDNAEQLHATKGRTDASYNLTLARIPSLRVLNYTSITPRDREEGEIYYLSIAEKEIMAFLKAHSVPVSDSSFTIAKAKMLHPRYEELCQNQDRESVFVRYTSSLLSTLPSSTDTTSAPGTLAARILHTIFYMSTNSSSSTQNDIECLSQVTKPLICEIPRTVDVYRLKALLTRRWGLPPLQFRLIYESPELDPVKEGEDQATSSWNTWGNWDVDAFENNNQHGTLNHASQASSNKVVCMNSVPHSGGKRWKKREVEIVDGTRAWGDYIEDEGAEEVTIRVEPFDADWREQKWPWYNEFR